MLGCVLVALLSAGPAIADSMVFIRDGNVWLANPDGSGQYQVTLDGTPDSPYSSPSQADDGTTSHCGPRRAAGRRSGGCTRTGGW